MSLITIRLNGDEAQVRATTVADLLAERGLDARAVAVEHNGQVVRRADHPSIPLRTGDRIEIVRFVQGG